jgi:hypothetical protein
VAQPVLPSFSSNLDKSAASRPSSLIHQVMSNAEYRQNAARMKKILAETNGLEKAVDLLEEAFQLPSELSCRQDVRRLSPSFFSVIENAPYFYISCQY